MAEKYAVLYPKILDCKVGIFLACNPNISVVIKDKVVSNWVKKCVYIKIGKTLV